MDSQGMGRNDEATAQAAGSATRDTDENVKKELERLQKLVEGNMPSVSCDALMPLIHNLAWQKVKLDETRRKLMYEDLFVPYDNGGGQRGIREHPGFAAYNKLYTTFARGIRQLADSLAEDTEHDELLEYFNETRMD